MKNKLITIFAVIGAVAAIAGAVAYILSIKKQIDGIVDGEQEERHEKTFNFMFDYMCCTSIGMQQCETRS